ncbi:hypothetical protein HOI26_00685 [Candidatus Woesearchaeota archaeon]|nr:hypothetical protein [Candidatus Woesearchaeota archaeon]MBT5739590.1 hypothetical protein [Candidatus Woesearchaeota archaeon]
MPTRTVKAIILLNIVLIMMTAVWILVGVIRGLSALEMWYNYTYVTLNIGTLILNLLLIRS